MLFRSNCDHVVEEIFNLSEKKNCKIIYPVDVSVSKKIDGKANIKKIAEVQKDDLILDIGPETLKIISKTIEGSKTVLWNGPAGYFENENFKKGSLEIARKIVEKNKKNEIRPDIQRIIMAVRNGIGEIGRASCRERV